MPYFVALDGGGTKTECWVGDESRVVGQASGPTVKIMNVGEQASTANLRHLVREALGTAGVQGDAVAGTCFGLAGSTSAEVRDWAKRTLSEIVSGEIIITGDEQIALDAAFHGGPGVLVIAGTGSNFTGRCADGTTVGVGGWGPVLGDEGSGTWIGVEAIRACLRARDRNVDTCMLRRIQDAWGLEDLGALVARANLRERPDFASLTTLVAECAESGDALAQGVLEHAGEELANQVSLVISKMRVAGCAAEDASRVAFTGSVLGKIPRVLRSMEQHLRAAWPEIVVDSAAVQPLEGALWRARQRR